MPGYAADLAYIHDAGFTGLAEQGADFVIGLLRGRGSESGLVVDLGCGSGAAAARFTAAGYDVEGIDQSPALLAIARERAPAARLRAGSFVTAPLPACDAVVAFGEVFSYAFDRDNTAEALPAVLQRIARALRPRGILVFDLAGPGRAGSGRDWTEGRDWVVLVERSETAGTLTRRIVTFRAEGERYRRGEEVHRLHLHAAGDVLRMLRAAGLRARALRGYGPDPLGPGLTAFVATRR